MTVAHSPTPAAAGHLEPRARLRAAAGSPGAVVPALMDGVLGLILLARNCGAREAERVRLAAAARSVIEVLRGSLDASGEESLSANLDELYGYMCRQLSKAEWHEGTDPLDEVAHLMHELRGAWSALPHVMRPSLAGAVPEGA